MNFTELSIEERNALFFYESLTGNKVEDQDFFLALAAECEERNPKRAAMFLDMAMVLETRGGF